MFCLRYKWIGLHARNGILNIESNQGFLDPRNINTSSKVDVPLAPEVFIECLYYSNLQTSVSGGEFCWPWSASYYPSENSHQMMTKCWANVSVYGPTLSQHTMVCRLKVAEERDAENDVVIKTTGTSSPQANNSILRNRNLSEKLPKPCPMLVQWTLWQRKLWQHWAKVWFTYISAFSPSPSRISTLTFYPHFLLVAGMWDFRILSWEQENLERIITDLFSLQTHYSQAGW